jgi:hypothetical protein
MIIGLGKQVKKQEEDQIYTVSFVAFTEGLSYTITGSAPTIADTASGATLTIPNNATLSASQDGTAATFVGWSDGNGLYSAGSTYTMPNSNVTFTGIWTTIYAPSITSFSPTSGPIGTVVDFYGINMGSATDVKFWRNKFATFTVLSDSHIRATVPALTTYGKPTIITSGGLGVTIENFTVV